MKDQASSDGAHGGEWWPGRRGNHKPERSTGSRRSAGRAVGRVVLWALICVVLARGLADILAGSAPDAERPRSAAATFPNAEARTFAVRFARSYFDGGSLHSFFSDGLSDHAAIDPLRRGPGTKVAWAMVAREAFLGSSRALITVAVSAGRYTRYLTVPVARDRDGGLAVIDLPSMSPPPPRGNVAATEAAPLTDSDAGPIGDLAERFLRTYLGGAGPRELAYYLAPGAGVMPMPPGLRLVAVDQLDGMRARRGHRGVRVLARVRDDQSGTEFALRYRLEVAQRDRWLVSAVAGGPVR